MREILFRGKRIDNGELVYGFYLHCYEQNKHYILSGKLASYPASPAHQHLAVQGFEWFEVIPETVGQYINVKDDYKYKIFEGDILRQVEDHPCNPDETYIRIYSVQLTNGCFLWNGECVANMKEDSYEFEIIGNVTDNKELLEVKE